MIIDLCDELDELNVMVRNTAHACVAVRDKGMPLNFSCVGNFGFYIG
jgi:hypothetical protein